MVLTGSVSNKLMQPEPVRPITWRLVEALAESVEGAVIPQPKKKNV